MWSVVWLCMRRLDRFRHAELQSRPQPNLCQQAILSSAVVLLCFYSIGLFHLHFDGNVVKTYAYEIERRRPIGRRKFCSPEADPQRRAFGGTDSWMNQHDRNTRWSIERLWYSPPDEKHIKTAKVQNGISLKQTAEPHHYRHKQWQRLILGSSMQLTQSSHRMNLILSQWVSWADYGPRLTDLVMAMLFQLINNSGRRLVSHGDEFQFWSW